MSKINKIIEVILQKFIDDLKKNKTISCAGSNLWVDLGRDICQGDGDICNHVKDLLELMIERLPKDVRELIWSESWGGKVRIEEILEELKKSNGDLNTIPKPEPDEILEDTRCSTFKPQPMTQKAKSGCP